MTLNAHTLITDSPSSVTIMSLYLRGIGWIAPIALVVLIVTTCVRISVDSLWLYERLFERNNVPERTGLTIQQLQQVGTQIQEYFEGGYEPLKVELSVDGVRRDLFNQREISHMSDVKQLLGKTYLAQLWAALAIGSSIFAVSITLRRQAVLLIAVWLKRSSIITLALVLSVVAGSTLTFDRLFLLFHHIGFPQGNFTFNPQTDYLVRVFPTGFWSDITFALGALILATSIMALGMSIILKRIAESTSISRKQ